MADQSNKQPAAGTQRRAETSQRVSTTFRRAGILLLLPLLAMVAVWAEIRQKLALDR